MENMSKKNDVVKLIRKEKMIICGEVTMAKWQTIETSTGDILQVLPFGRRVMVFGGDFWQELPVVPKLINAEIVNASLVKSYLWTLMEKVQFTRNMRARIDPTFSEFLLHMGNGD